MCQTSAELPPQNIAPEMSPAPQQNVPQLPQLPQGTVTFLFTDIQGSTRLWQEHTQAMQLALARHDALARNIISAHGGTLVKSRGEGDSLFCVFSRATDAVAAACHLQCALAEEPWPAGITLPVRMALHSSEAELRDGDYFGPALSRCARLRATAHGAQVLLSAATHELVQDTLPQDMSLLSLGEHQLRDL
jgi:class 3 adenylate cyclase